MFLRLSFTCFITEPGAAPTEIETQILQKVEGAVSKIGNVKNIISRATEGQALVFVEFQIGTPVDRATTDVRDAVARDPQPICRQGILEPNRWGARRSTAVRSSITRSAPPA